MCRPLLSITAWHLLLHERINVWHSSMDIFSHSPFKLVHSSSTFLGFVFLPHSFSNFQTFSIGFMSGLWAGNFIAVTSSSERNILTDFSVWHGVLSCINTAGWFLAVLKLGICFFNISLHAVASVLSCSLIRSPVQAATEIIPNTSFKSNAAFSSLGLYQTNFLPSTPNRLNLTFFSLRLNMKTFSKSYIIPPLELTFDYIVLITAC